MKPKQAKAVPRETWLLMADAHGRTPRELLWLAGRSLDVIQAGYAGRDGLGTGTDDMDGSELSDMARARRIAERRILEELDGPDRTQPEGFLEAELRCLLNTLQEMAGALTWKAEACSRLARTVKRGRPPKRDLNLLVSPEGFRWAKPKSVPRKAGRRRAAAISDGALLAELQQAKTANSDRSERALLEGIARRLLAAEGKHTAGDRVPRLTANLQKRVAAARAGGIPKLIREIAEIRLRKSE